MRCPMRPMPPNLIQNWVLIALSVVFREASTCVNRVVYRFGEERAAKVRRFNVHEHERIPGVEAGTRRHEISGPANAHRTFSAVAHQLRYIVRPTRTSRSHPKNTRTDRLASPVQGQPGGMIILGYSVPSRLAGRKRSEHAVIKTFCCHFSDVLVPGTVHSRICHLSCICKAVYSTMRCACTV